MGKRRKSARAGHPKWIVIKLLFVWVAIASSRSFIKKFLELINNIMFLKIIKIFNLHKKLSVFTCTVIFALISGCAENIKTEPMDIVSRRVDSTDLKNIPPDVPTLILSKKELAALLSEWSDSSNVAMQDSDMPLDARDGAKLFAIVWGISNSNLCNRYKLVSIEKKKIQPSKIDTAYEGVVNFNPILYSEIWYVETCGKTRRWYEADDDGKFLVHSLLPDY